MKKQIPLIFLILYLVTIQSLAQTTALSTKHNSTVENEYLILNNGDTIYGRVKFSSSNKSSYINLNYFMLHDSIRYEGRDVKAFKSSDGYFAKIFGERNYVRRDVEGKIDLYSSAIRPASPELVHHPDEIDIAYNPGYYNSFSYEYLSKERDSVYEADYSHLRESLKDNPKSLALLDEYRSLSYVKYAAGIIGLGIIASAFTGREDLKNPDNELIVVGAAIVGFGYYIPALFQKEKIRGSIEIYNGLR